MERTSIEARLAFQVPDLIPLLALAAAAVTFSFLLSLLMSRLRRRRAHRASLTYSRRALLNGAEKRVFRMVETEAAALFGSDARVFAQVAYGGFAEGSSRAARDLINGRRADFLVVGPDLDPVCVIEYHGSGHLGWTVASRDVALRSDAAKRHALAAANIPLVELPKDATRETVRQQLTAATFRDG